MSTKELLIGAVCDFEHIREARIAFDSGKVNGKLVVEVWEGDFMMQTEKRKYRINYLLTERNESMELPKDEYS